VTTPGATTAECREPTALHGVWAEPTPTKAPSDSLCMLTLTFRIGRTPDGVVMIVLRIRG
jgi:hypothetical protein